MINELAEVKNLESEFVIKKEGNLRNLADIVHQQAKNNPINKKKLVWLKRFIDKRYICDPID